MAKLNVSNDIFEDSSCTSQSSPPKGSEEWHGVCLQDLKLNSTEDYVPVKNSKYHHVIFQLPIKDDGPLEPFPAHSSDVWDAFHVRMPHSPQSLYPVSEVFSCDENQKKYCIELRKERRAPK